MVTRERGAVQGAYQPQAGYGMPLTPERGQQGQPCGSDGEEQGPKPSPRRNLFLLATNAESPKRVLDQVRKLPVWRPEYEESLWLWWMLRESGAPAMPNPDPRMFALLLQLHGYALRMDGLIQEGDLWFTGETYEPKGPSIGIVAKRPSEPGGKFLAVHAYSVAQGERCYLTSAGIDYVLRLPGGG